MLVNGRSPTLVGGSLWILTISPYLLALVHLASMICHLSPVLLAALASGQPDPTAERLITEPIGFLHRSTTPVPDGPQGCLAAIGCLSSTLTSI